MKTLKKFKNRKGFTLIELIVVIVILGTLLAILIPSVGNAKQRAQEVSFDMARRRLHEAAIMFTIDFPHTQATWASHDGGTEARKDIEITKDNTFEAWYLYLEEYPKDPTRPDSTFIVEISANGDIDIHPEEPERWLNAIKFWNYKARDYSR